MSTTKYYIDSVAKFLPTSESLKMKDLKVIVGREDIIMHDVQGDDTITYVTVIFWHYRYNQPNGTIIYNTKIVEATLYSQNREEKKNRDGKVLTKRDITDVVVQNPNNVLGEHVLDALSEIVDDKYAGKAFSYDVNMNPVPVFFSKKMCVDIKSDGVQHEIEAFYAIREFWSTALSTNLVVPQMIDFKIDGLPFDEAQKALSITDNESYNLVDWLSLDYTKQGEDEARMFLSMQHSYNGTESDMKRFKYFNPGNIPVTSYQYLDEVPAITEANTLTEVAA